MRRRFSLTAAVWIWAGVARGADSGGASDEAQRALAEGMAALGGGPPRWNEARHAFERATALQGEPKIASPAHFWLAVLDEGDAAPARALAHYHACIDAAPATRWARTARKRIEWIDQRSEGDLAPLAALERVRRDQARPRDPATIDRLAIAAESFPPGLVRSEARMLAAEDWLKRPARRDDALAELRKVISDPSSGASDAHLAERDLVDALVADNHLDAAATESLAHPLDSKSAVEVQRLVRRRTLTRVACAALLIAAALLMVALRRARRLRGRAEAH